jgi:Na+-transporting NADH:ubiquinone oxidoreductase subunit NqrD
MSYTYILGESLGCLLKNMWTGIVGAAWWTVEFTIVDPLSGFGSGLGIPCLPTTIDCSHHTFVVGATFTAFFALLGFWIWCIWSDNSRASNKAKVHSQG